MRENPSISLQKHKRLSVQTSEMFDMLPVSKDYCTHTQCWPMGTFRVSDIPFETSSSQTGCR